MLIFSVQTYGQTVTKVVTLSDETYIVTIDGRDYKALPVNQVKNILKDREELRILRIDFVTLSKDYDLYRDSSTKALEAAKQITVTESLKRDKQIDFWKSEYDKELKLRTSFGTTLGRCHKFIIWRIC